MDLVFTIAGAGIAHNITSRSHDVAMLLLSNTDRSYLIK
jgi:hypothetical protein